MRLAVAPSLLALAATAVLAAPAWADDPPPGSVPPDQDPFYAAPADIGTYRPGQVVATRKITPKAGNLAGTVDAWQISYRTNDSHDRAELTVTTLLVPKKAWTGGGSRPAVSVQAAEDSTGTQCAPSYGISSGSLVAASSVMFAAPLLDKGWTVAMPDFEGPKSVFMAGPQAGHAVLDGIRAVKNVNSDVGRWALNGYSGGAQATGWAAELQPSYAPDVGLAGVTMGGTPADPGAVARSLDGGLFSGFEAAATVSLDTEFPEAGIGKLLNDKGRQALEDSRNKCVTDLLTGFPFKKLADYSTVPDPLSVPSVAAMLKKNTMGSSAPAAPVFDYHANTDEIVPVGQADALVKTWCSKGATVQTVRDAVGEHALEALVRNNDVLAYLTDRFAGKPAPDTC
ncbi:triacylglycerol lipase [Actinomadura darangshiensis]|uniref:Triacylglycerol lipase n=1 Tax=Actinomadura darangshiensis TaxID=705336 RepID=A0A4R5AIJ7_9ACTN|nr:lipase family protein [Actinomadura darangshiensis]TDD72463.1 triacylglycerol lipase [Actinomadura darangshiensis]